MEVGDWTVVHWECEQGRDLKVTAGLGLGSTCGHPVVIFLLSWVGGIHPCGRGPGDSWVGGMDGFRNGWTVPAGGPKKLHGQESLFGEKTVSWGENP